MNSISFVYFDLGNILYRFDRERSIRQMADHLGVEPAIIRRIVVTEGLGDAHERGEIDDDQFVDWLRRGVGITRVDDAASLLDAGSDMFELIDGMPEIVDRVAGTTGTGLLSNTSAAHFRWIKQIGDSMMQSFDPVILSYQAGVMKPSRDIYVAAERASGVLPHQILFVDDKPENVAAAIRCGWNAEICEGRDQVDAALKRYGI